MRKHIEIFHHMPALTDHGTNPAGPASHTPASLSSQHLPSLITQLVESATFVDTLVQLAETRPELFQERENNTNLRLAIRVAGDTLAENLIARTWRSENTERIAQQLSAFFRQQAIRAAVAFEPDALEQVLRKLQYGHLQLAILNRVQAA